MWTKVFAGNVLLDARHREVPANHVAAKADRRRRGRILLFVACGVLTIAGYHIGGLLVQPGLLNNHHLVIAPSELNLGTQWARPRFEHIISVRNKGKSTASILEFMGPCNCITVTPDTFDIAPGESQEVQLVLNMDAPPVAGHPVASREVNVDLVTVIKGSPSPARWRLKGIARNPLFPSAPVVDFVREPVNVDTGTLPTRRITVEVVPDVSKLRAICDATLAKVDVQPVLNRRGSTPSYLLSVTPSRDLPVGAFTGTIDLEAVMRSGERFLTTPLALHGVIVTDIEFMPSSAVFPAGVVGEVLSIQVVARSRTNRKFTVVKARCECSPDIAGHDLALPAADHVLTIHAPVRGLGASRSIVPLDVCWDDGTVTHTSLVTQTYGLCTSEELQDD